MDDTYIGLIENEADRALQGAHIIGLIQTDNDEHNGYVERGYVITWQRDNHGGHRGEGVNWGTHRAQVNNSGEAMLIHGHYDIPSREDALSDMLKRAAIRVA
jgi:hypothetical protein